MASMKNLVGQTLGQYKIVEKIGEGGMATVFKAYQPGLNRDVALKILPPYVAAKEGFTERFTREAQAIGNLHHPNILPVYDFGQDKGYGYIAMRYVPHATTLAGLMKNPLPPQQVVELTAQIAGALEHAHQKGIIHRDINPSNILRDKTWVLLSDFGLAKMVETPSELTGSGVGIGTPSYMSPEQAKGESVDHRTDIYSLGIIVFEMLTGQVPHKAETPLATVVKRINEPLPMPRSLNPNIPSPVERVLLKALAMDPANRFDSAEGFAGALKAAYNPPEQQARASERFERAAAIPLEPVEQAPPPQTPRPIAPPVPAKSSTRMTSIEIVFMTILGIITLCGVSGVFLSFVPDSDTGELNLELAPACLGMVFDGVTSLLMIWIRERSKPASALFALGIIFWFVGVNILGWGGFALASPGEDPFLENLGLSVALCFAPGGLLTLLGLELYGYDFRNSRKAASSTFLSQASVSGEAPAKNNRADTLQRAAQYRTRIETLVKQKKGSPMANHLAQIVPKLSRLQAHLQQLVNRLNDFEADPVLQRDIRDVPAAILRLESQLAAETNPQVRHEIVEALDRHKEHKRQLDALATIMRRTELDIDETLAAIGAIYSQLQIIGAKDIDSQRANRLSADVNEQANRLGDLLNAMDDVYESTAGFDRLREE